MRSFGGVVREYRLRAGLSQEELAGRAGAAVKTIGNIEAGRTVPRLSTVWLLADALGLEGAERHRFCAMATTGERPLRARNQPPMPATTIVAGIVYSRIICSGPSSSSRRLSDWPATMMYSG